MRETGFELENHPRGFDPATIQPLVRLDIEYKCGRQGSNLRRQKPKDLESFPFDHSGTPAYPILILSNIKTFSIPK